MWIRALLTLLATLAIASQVAAEQIVYVNASACGANDGSSWGDAFVDLQDALETVEWGDEIWVAEGTYTPGPPGAPLDSKTFALSGGVALFGGFGGFEHRLADRDWLKYATILSGDLAGDGTEKVRHVLTATNIEASVIDGFIIRDGHAGGAFGGGGNSIVWGNAAHNVGDVQGNQISVENGTVNVQHSIIEGLIADGEFDLPGAGMNNLGDDPLFVNPTPAPGPPGNGEDADFRLLPTSPAIDAGDNSLLPDPKEFPGAETDLDGQPRIVDGDGDGIAIVDIGAYEFTGEPGKPVPPDPDLNGDGIVNEQDLLLLLAAWGPCADCTTTPG